MTLLPAAPHIIEACARAAHEANRAYCIAIGDTSQPSWEDAPNWQRASSRNGVTNALLGATPRESHVTWCAEKWATGWKRGDVKDPEAKTHPCLVDYDDLPPEQRAKDTVYLCVVRSVAVALGAPVVYPDPAF